MRSVIALPQAAQKQMPVSIVGPLTTRGAVSAGLASNDPSTWTVTDDWPDEVPVTEAEIEVFEA